MVDAVLTKEINGRATLIQADANRQASIYARLDQTRLKSFQSTLNAQLAAEARFRQQATELAAAGSQREADIALATANKIAQDRINTEAQVASEKLKLETDANNAALLHAQDTYSQMSVANRASYQRTLAANLEAKKAAAMEELAIANATNNQQAIDAANKLKEQLDNQIAMAKAEANALENAVSSATANSADNMKSQFINSLNFISSNTKEKEKKKQEVLKSDKGVIEAEKELARLRANGTKEQIKDAKESLKRAKDAALENNGLAQSFADATAETFANIGKGVAELGANAVNALVSLLGAALNAVTNSIDGNVESMFGDQGRINTRLQGNQVFGGSGWWNHSGPYASIVDKIQENIGVSGVVSQKDVVAKMVQLADSGVVYNLEMRAFLAATAENIASTFDAFDLNLLRLIRIQQADTTAARMGMEQSLTELFNKYFSDSSYMNKGGAADSVSASIIDAMSQMTKDNALSFEYTLQKWLGALYSLGLSDNAVNTIAQGINYLGTGNVNALNGNDSLQTLLAMSAARSGGKSYAELLTGGLTAEDTNELLKSMIEYLAEIAASQKNMVTKAAYSDLFGMTITDLSTFQQLQAEEVENLYRTNLNYTDMMQKTQTQLATMVDRINIGKIIDTAVDNAMTGAAVDVANNPVLYGTWKVLNLIESLTGGIAIPAVEVYGFMVDLHTTVEGLAKSGIAGIGLMGSLLSSLFSGSLLGTFNLDQWGYEETTKRGAAITQLFEGTSSGVSQTTELAMTGSASAEDLKSTSKNDATQGAQEESGTTSEEMQEGKELTEKIYDAIADSETDTVFTQLRKIVDVVEVFDNNMSRLLDKERVFYTASASGRLVSSSRVSSILNAYSNMESSAMLNSTVATTERASLLHAIAESTSQQASSNAALSETDSSLSDIIVQAVSAAIIASANDLTFKTEIDNSFGNPIAVKSVV